MIRVRTFPLWALALTLACDADETPKPATPQSGAKTASNDPKPAKPVAKDVKEAAPRAAAPEDEPSPERGEPAADPPADAEIKAAFAAKLAGEIKASPDDLDKILSAHELTQAEFSAMLYEIAEDPETAMLYAEAIEGQAPDPEQG